jgi:Domain of unknown function (DUF4352)
MQILPLLYFLFFIGTKGGFMSYQPPPNNQPWQQPQQPNTYYPPQQQVPWQQPPKKKSKVGLIVGIIAAILVLSCIGVFALVGTAAKNTTTGTISSSTSATTSATSTTNQVAKVGQTITVDSVAATLVSAKTLAADEFTKPKPGNQFIVVHIKMVNNGSDEKDYNPFDFHAKSGSGNITDEEIPPSTYTANNELNSGKLSAGGTVEGDIVFQVPKGDHKALLTWQPSFFGNAGDNGWNLGF